LFSRACYPENEAAATIKRADLRSIDLNHQPIRLRFSLLIAKF
jgi:hypothetical protein